MSLSKPTNLDLEYSSPLKRKRTDKGQGRADRYCVHCGYVIYNQVVEKPGNCPLQACKGMLLYRVGSYTEWGRCPDCDSFIQRDMCYCQLCGRGQPVAIQRRDRKAKADAEAAKAKLVARNRELAEDNSAKAKKLEDAEAEVQRLREIVKSQDSEIIRKTLEGVILEENGMNEIDEVTINESN